MNLCVICDKRPKQKQGDYCTPCTDQIDTEQAENAARRQWWQGAERVLHYREHVITLKPSGGLLHPAYQGMPSVKGVPPDLLVDLDVFCPGFQRHTIKKYKGLFRPFLPDVRV